MGLIINNSIESVKEFFRTNNDRPDFEDRIKPQLTLPWFEAYYESKYYNWDDVRFFFFQNTKGELSGFLPFSIEEKNWTPLFKRKTWNAFGDGVNDFFDPYCRMEDLQEFSRDICSWFSSNTSKWDQISLNFIPYSNQLIAEILNCLPESEFLQIEDRSRAFYYLPTNLPWEEYYTPQFHKKIRDIRGRKNRLEKAGHGVKVEVVERDILDKFDDFLVHFNQRRDQKGEVSSYRDVRKRNLIKTVIPKLEDEGKVILSLLTDQNGKHWAYQLDLLNDQIWYHYAPTFDFGYKEFSPSKILLFESIKTAFEDPDILEFNFMRGESGYKEQFTSQKGSYRNILLEKKRSSKRSMALIYHSLSKLKPRVS